MNQTSLDKIKKLLEQHHDKTIILLNNECEANGYEYVTLLNADNIKMDQWTKIPLASVSKWHKREYSYLYLGIIDENTPLGYSSYSDHSVNNKNTKIFWFSV